MACNYVSGQINEIFISNIPEGDFMRNMKLNQLFILNSEEYIICFARRREVAIARLIFPGRDTFFYDYIYFSAIRNKDNLLISGLINFHANRFEHAQIKNIRRVGREIDIE